MEDTIIDSLVREGIFEKRHLSRGMNEVQRKNIQIETSKYKGLETGASTLYLRNCKENSKQKVLKEEATHRHNSKNARNRWLGD